jgi:transcriptional regulator with XRE-family HTH domain
MENFLQTRTAARLAALELNAFQAAERCGFDRYFIYDLTSGKKDTVRPKAILKMAEGLDCDPEYLIGAQAEPRRPGTSPQTANTEAGNG